MSFHDISCLEPWQLVCSMGWNNLCNFCRERHEKQFCEIILNLDQWLRRCHLRTRFILSSCGQLFSGPEPFVEFW